MIKNVETKIEGYELLSQKVYIVIKDLIVKDILPAGSPISEKIIAQDLGVSLTPVREAFRKLSSEGFLQTFPNKKALVRNLSNNDIKNSLSIRELLEGLAARLATPNLEESDIKSMEFYLEQMKEASIRKDINCYLDQYRFFQNIILKKCQNNLLKQMINNLREISQYYNIRSLKIEGRFKNSINEHIQIFNAYKEKNSRKAEILSRRHIRKVLENILRHKQ